MDQRKLGFVGKGHSHLRKRKANALRVKCEQERTGCEQERTGCEQGLNLQKRFHPSDV